MNKPATTFFLFILFFPTIRNFAKIIHGSYIPLWISIPLFLITTLAVWKLLDVLLYNQDQAYKAENILDKIIEAGPPGPNREWEKPEIFDNPKKTTTMISSRLKDPIVIVSEWKEPHE